MTRQPDDTQVCPSCGTVGRSVPRVTIESLVSKAGRRGVGQVEGLRFCATPSCDVAYYHSDSGQTIAKNDVRVRIGSKESESPRPVCYCFDHTVEEIEAEVAAKGNSKIADDIVAKCRQGLDRCQETNPQGACCLGSVRTVVKEAMARARGGSASRSGTSSAAASPDCCADGKPAARDMKPSKAPLTGRWATTGAVLAAVLSSACCWLPLLLVALGVSAAGVAGAFESYRPIFLVVAAAFLATGLYRAYLRKPSCAPGEMCVVPITSVQRINRVGLWIATVLVLGFALFPNYVAALSGGSGSSDETAAAASEEVVIEIEGMTCAACGISIRAELERVAGVQHATVDYDARQAVVAIGPGATVGDDALFRAVEKAGFGASRLVHGVRYP